MCGYFCIEFIDFMFEGKTLTEYTSLFSPNNFEKNGDKILSYFKNEWKKFYKTNPIDKTNLTEQTKFRPSETVGIENYFYQEINQRKSCSKRIK